MFRLAVMLDSPTTAANGIDFYILKGCIVFVLEHFLRFKTKAL